MIWRSIRDGFVAEFLAWSVFLLLSLVLGFFGMRSLSPSASNALGIVWFALFVAFYIILHKRRQQRG